MLFNSMAFWLFFPVVTALFFASPRRSRWAVLLLASYFFYGWWDVRFLVLIVLSTVIDYAAGLGMAGEKLAMRTRVGVSALILGTGALFLLPHWPAVQADDRSIDWSALLEGASWTGAPAAMGIVAAFALLGPLLYELFFLLPLAARRRAFLVTSLVANLGLLGFFKYFNFFTDNVYGVSDLFGLGLERPDDPILNVALPVGISFYTFQTMSYTIDVFRNQCGVERHLGKFALYVSFYPQLVAGPIERAKHLLPQISERQRFDPDRVADGVRLMFWGLFKKVCIADRLAIYVDSVYNDVGANHSGPTYLLATYFFAWQIYCDFSGYTDIARGAAKVMGFDLMENFRRPYFAQTITEFWRRWHISLSSWLRDYLYIPLGGNRLGVSRTYINLMITMLLGGLWHGASWNFVVWGGLQGVMLACSKATLPARERLIERVGPPGWLVAGVRIFITFHLCCLSWVFFRAVDLSDSIYIITHIPTGWPELRLNPAVTAYCFAFLAVLLTVQVVQERRGPIIPMINAWPLPLRWAVALAVLFSIILFGVDGGAQFIYFTF